MKKIALAILVSLAMTITAPPLSARDVDRSRLYNLEALKLLKARNYEEAVKQFQKAFYAAPASGPLINIAKTYEVMKRKDLALEYYRMAIEYSETAAEKEDLARQVARIKDELLQQMAMLQIRTPGVEAEITVKFPGTGSVADQCLSPCELWMGEGSYIVAATRKGYRYQEKNVTVAGKGVMLVTLEMEQTEGRGTLDVSSNVAGVGVLVNGTRVGKTPFRQSFLPGRVTVRLEQEGYQPWETEVAVAPEETHHLHVYLKSDEEVLAEGNAAAAAVVTPPKAPAPPKEPEVKAPPKEAPAATEAGKAPVAAAAVACPEAEPREVVREKVVIKEVGPGKGVPKFLKWIFWCTGAAALGAGAGLQVVGAGRIRDANNLSAGEPDYRDRYFGLYDSGKGLTRDAWLLYGAGVVSAATGTILFLLEGPGAAAAPAKLPADLLMPPAPKVTP
jgi:hypothetical protein